jgi:predicted nucleic acid-binding protein
LRGFLLDTNVLSELRRPRPHPGVVDFVSARAEDELFVSEVTFAEIRYGIEQAADAERRANLTAWLANTLRPLFDGRTLRLTETILLRWRLLIEAGRRRGHTFSQFDLFIAATAAEEGLVVVTRDETHFVAAGAAVLDPWSGSYTLPARGNDDPQRGVIADPTQADLLGRFEL